MKNLKNLLSKIDPSLLPKKERQLLNAILSDDWQIEKDLAESIWPGEKHQTEYLRLNREKLLKRSLDQIFSFEGKPHNQRFYGEAYKEFAGIQILAAFGLRKELIYFAEHLIKRAVRYEMTEIVSSLANILYHHYGSIEGSVSESRKYLKLAERYDDLLIAERKLQRRFVDLASDFSSSRTGVKGTLEKATDYLDYVNSAPSDYDSFWFRYYAYYIQCIHAQLTGDTQSLSSACDEALLYFQKKTYSIPNSVHFLFGFEQRASLALQLRDYELALKTIHWGKEAMSTSPYNLGICLIYQVTIGFHCGDPDLVRAAIEESSQYEISGQQREQWIIIRAYAHLLGILPDEHFRLSKFLNELPKFSKDKAGLNVSIITIQLLYYLKKGDYAQLIDRREALQKYCNRYLSGRADSFVRMLLAISLHDFDPERIEFYALDKGYLQQLVDGAQVEDAEIVPFERLWEEVMAELLAAGRRELA